MSNNIQTTATEFQSAETRKEWVAPELKMISIKDITAAGGTAHPDGSGGSKS